MKKLIFKLSKEDDTLVASNILIDYELQFDEDNSNEKKIVFYDIDNLNKFIKLFKNLEQLPYTCYGVLMSENIVISIQKGDSGYTPLSQLKPDEKYKTVEEIANALNEEKKITKAQRSAMEWGSQFGWDHGLADTSRYNENGVIIKNLQK